MLTVYEFDGIVPVVHPTAYVHPAAVLIGDVIIGPRCYVAPGASLRGDMGRLVIGEGSNIQDNVVIHTLPNQDTVIEANGHIGHGSVLHGCRVRTNALVGMSAVIMDGAVIGECSIVGAMAFVPARMVIEPRVLVAGIPAKVVRALSDAEIAWKSRGTAIYQEVAQRCLTGCRPVQARTEMEPDRRRVDIPEFVPIHEARRRDRSGG